MLTQERLAELAGMSVTGIRKLERGSRTRPQTVTVRRLAAALQLGPSETEAFIRAAQAEVVAEDGPVGQVHGRFTIPIDLERDTRLALLELLYGLQRDARRSWRKVGSRRRSLLRVVALVGLAYAAGVLFADRLHVLSQLLAHLLR